MDKILLTRVLPAGVFWHRTPRRTLDDVHKILPTAACRIVRFIGRASRHRDTHRALHLYWRRGWGKTHRVRWWRIHPVICMARHKRSSPVGGLVLDGKGNLYGVTNGGLSVVFRLSPPTAQGSDWTFSVLCELAESVLPNPLVRDSHGNLYGTTQYGGSGQFSYGQAYELSPPASTGEAWTFTSLHSFQGPPTDGAYPSSNLSVDAAGNLFGTTSQGGKGTCFDAGTVIGCGTVFEISPSGGAWTETSIYDFTVHENNAPYWDVFCAYFSTRLRRPSIWSRGPGSSGSLHTGRPRPQPGAWGWAGRRVIPRRGRRGA